MRYPSPPCLHCIVSFLLEEIAPGAPGELRKCELRARDRAEAKSKSSRADAFVCVLIISISSKPVQLDARQEDS